MKTLKGIILLLFLLASSIPAFAVEVAPRISDREIIERLSRLDGGQKSLRTEMTGRFADLRSDMNARFADLRSDMNARFADLRSDMNARFDTLELMLKLFVGIATVILGFVLRMQWQMNRRQSQMETALETQKDEMNFLKGLIDKLLPPKGAL